MQLFEFDDLAIPGGAHVDTLNTDDGVILRYARWEATAQKNRGTVCLFPGIPETIEHYLETVEDILDRGYAVAVFDWRSQGGSARSIVDIGKVHVRSFDEYRLDFAAFIQRVKVECEPPYYCLGFSSGALNLLRSLSDDPHIFDRAIAISPVITKDFHGMPEWLVHIIGNILVGVGLGDLPSQRFQAGKSHAVHRHTGHMTDDPVRSERYWKAYLLDPSLLSNQRTWAWTVAFSHASDQVGRPDFGRSIDIPLLVTHGASDHLAAAEPLEALVKRVPNATYFEIPDGRHIILHETDEIRSVFWEKFGEFIP